MKSDASGKRVVSVAGARPPVAARNRTPGAARPRAPETRDAPHAISGDPAHVEPVVDEPREVLELTLQQTANPVEPPRMDDRWIDDRGIDDMRVQQLHRVVHGGQRVAQLVREDPEKLILAKGFVLQRRLRTLALRKLVDELRVGVREHRVQRLEL